MTFDDGFLGRTIYDGEVVNIVEEIYGCNACCFRNPERKANEDCVPGKDLQCTHKRYEKSIIFVRDLDAYKVARVTHTLTNGKLT